MGGGIGSRFSVLVSQFSVLSSQFSILSFQSLILVNDKNMQLEFIS